MLLGLPKETHPGEHRVALIPSSIERLIKSGFQICVETDFGATIGIKDADYKSAGASISDLPFILSKSEIVARLRKPSLDNIQQLKSKAVKSPAALLKASF